jgi:hypothetical protein
MNVNYPTGALQSIEELKKSKDGTFYMIVPPRAGLHPHAMMLTFKKGSLFKVEIDYPNRKYNITFDKRDNDSGRYTYWSPFSGLYFPFHGSAVAYLFNNYFFAYGYKLRTEKASAKSESS